MAPQSSSNRLWRSGAELTGCGLLGHQGIAYTMSPALPFYGAYFPSWLLCAALGVVGSVLIRILLIRLGIDEGIPFRSLVYIALAGLIGFAVAATAFGR